ncbi:hypothetical protein NNO_0235 [Hydrogenimonas sp.]|nr:hypothetical protein NNO_0235 [Hydrogenimonas sp.]
MSENRQPSIGNSVLSADALGALTGKRGFLNDIFPLKSRG